MITHDMQVGYWLDETTLARLDELCERFGVTRSHMVRCAVVSVGVDALDAEPLDVEDAPRVGRRAAGHAAGVGLARCMLRLTRAEYEVLCRSAVREGVSRAERIRRQVALMLERMDETTLRGFAESLNAMTVDRYARMLLDDLATRQHDAHGQDGHTALHAQSAAS